MANATYRWEITRNVYDPTDKYKLVGMYGPKFCAMGEAIEQPARRWQLLDGDGDVLVMGVIWGEFTGLEPLDDYGTGGLGAVAVALYDEKTDTWEVI